MADKRSAEAENGSAAKKAGHDEFIHTNLAQWIEDNQKDFLPPVCNKMLHKKGQMKSFFVGGPNQREDYHLECGEELFFMRKGDMELKIVERGKHKNVPIKEGEIFLLPGRIMHSPQRQANTIGLVLERERALCEKDGLRYFVEKDGKPTMDILFEDWFYCDDLGVQLGPVIKKYFASEQHKTGKPIPGDHLMEEIPLELDVETSVTDPFSLKEWIDSNRKEIDEKGRKNIFEGEHQFEVYVCGPGENSDQCKEAETFIWQIEGSSIVKSGDKEYALNEDENLLVPKNNKFTVIQKEGAKALVAYQDPERSSTWKPDF